LAVRASPATFQIRRLNFGRLVLGPPHTEHFRGLELQVEYLPVLRRSHARANPVTTTLSGLLLFGGWQVTVSKDKKATGEERYLRSGTSGAVVAGNWYGLPDKHKAPAGAANLWRTFAEALKFATFVHRSLDPAGLVDVAEHVVGHRPTFLSLSGA
jgi:hypothetical protein